ncbi:MAG: hypothetical protein KGL95_09575, partial [Patescibacteria group bacterium]|nr:hypothetical protein [Patescibacteria group bacterium]
MLTAEDFGIWNLILGLISYVMIEPVITYWTTREAARGEESARTAISFGQIFSLTGSLIYVVISFFMSKQSNIDQNVLLFAIILVPIMYLRNILYSINLGSKPQGTSYSLLISEIAKILSLLILFKFFGPHISDVIISIFTSQVIGVLILYVYTRKMIGKKIKQEFVKKWIRLSWLTLYTQVMVRVLVRSDILVFTAITQSVLGLAFYGAAAAIGSLSSFAGAISSAVYPKILEGKGGNFLQGNLTLLFYFSLPLTAISITFAKYALFVLNPIYEIASLVVVLVAIKTFFFTLNQTLEQFLRGSETVDMNFQSTHSDYLKSKLFTLPTARIIQYCIYLISLVLVLMFLNDNSNYKINQVIYWSLAALITEIPITIYLYIMTKRSFKIKIEYARISKYLLSSIIIFGLIFFLSDGFLKYNSDIF